MENKDLEQLFRDRFKDFQEMPDEGVWKSIEASLDKKKKKRVIPIWWQLGGVAALLAIIFYVINPFEEAPSIDNTTITDIKQKEQIEPNTEQNSMEEKSDSKSSFPSTNELTETNSSHEKPDSDSGNQQQLNNNSKYDAQSVLKEKESSQLASSTINDSKDDLAKDETNKNGTITEIQSSKETVAQVLDKTDENLSDKNLTPSNSENTEAIDVVVAENTEEVKGKSIYDAIEEQQEEEKEVVAENSDNKWSIGSAVAPVYFNGIGEGSPVHSNFSANSKSGNVNLSYGLTVAYELNKRLSVRTGVHRVSYGYDTNEIAFSSSLNASTNQDIDNINYNETSRGLVVESKASPSTANTNSTADFVARSPEFDGRMVQQIGYMEVPLELNYALIDKKFGVNLIGGMSSLFLVDNAVSLESDGLITEMGEANNVNDVNFSTNIGVGLNYKFSDKIQANVEPMFKYQLNTFSNTAGNFQPFSVGVYSGISFRF